MKCIAGETGALTCDNPKVYGLRLRPSEVQGAPPRSISPWNNLGKALHVPGIGVFACRSFKTIDAARLKRTTMEIALRAAGVQGPRVTEHQLAELWKHNPVRCAACAAECVTA